MSNLNELKPIINLNPFARFCCTIGNLPTSYMTSLTYEEQLMWLCDYLQNTVIPAVNNNAECVKELQELYVKLKNYVDNYFNNLDVQKEINNKLDKMAEDGTLDKIINQDIFGNLNQKVNTLSNTVNILTLPKKFLLVGDSYANGYTPDGTITSWCEFFKNKMNLSNENCIIKALNGSGFARPDYLWYDLINQVPNDDHITDVIIMGGYNDTDYSYSQIANGIINCKNLISQKFPNAKMYVGFIGWTNLSDRLLKLYNTFLNYNVACNNNSINFIDNIQYSLHDYFNYFSSDNIHPNVNGQEYIALNLVNFVINGVINITKPYINVPININTDLFVTKDLSTLLTQSLINNIVAFSLKTDINLVTNNVSFKCDGTDYKIGDFENSYLIGNSQKTALINSTAFLHADNKYFKVACTLKIYNKALYVSFNELNDAGTNWLSLNNVTNLQIVKCSTNIISNIN